MSCDHVTMRVNREERKGGRKGEEKGPKKVREREVKGRQCRSWFIKPDSSISF